LGKSKLNKPKVELRPAWEWTCDDCGKTNFASSITVEMPDDEKLQFAKHHGMIEEFVEELPEELQDADLMSQPIDVTCNFCNSRFETEDDEEE